MWKTLYIVTSFFTINLPKEYLFQTSLQLYRVLSEFIFSFQYDYQYYTSTDKHKHHSFYQTISCPGNALGKYYHGYMRRKLLCMSHVQNFHLVCLDKNSYCKLKLKTKFPLLVNETSLFHFSTILAYKYTKGKYRFGYIF